MKAALLIHHRTPSPVKGLPNTLDSQYSLTIVHPMKNPPPTMKIGGRCSTGSQRWGFPIVSQTPVTNSAVRYVEISLPCSSRNIATKRR
jgi:hypothetical protein